MIRCCSGGISETRALAGVIQSAFQNSVSGLETSRWHHDTDCTANFILSADATRAFFQRSNLCAGCPRGSKQSHSQRKEERYKSDRKTPLQTQMENI